MNQVLDFADGQGVKFISKSQIDRKQYEKTNVTPEKDQIELEEQGLIEEYLNHCEDAKSKKHLFLCSILREQVKSSSCQKTKVQTEDKNHTNESAKEYGRSPEKKTEDVQITFKNFSAHKKWLEDQSLNFNKNRRVEASAEDKELLKFLAEDESCVVCNQPTASTLNKILFCDLCKAGFHEACYGVVAPQKPETKWFCDPCKVHKLDGLRLKCSECPCLGGGMKRVRIQKNLANEKNMKSLIGTRHNLEDSISSISRSSSQEDITTDFDSQFLSQFSFYNTQYLNTASLEKQDQEWLHVNCIVGKLKKQQKYFGGKLKSRQICSCCGLKTGTIIKCVQPDCDVYFHAECARKTQLCTLKNEFLLEPSRKKLMSVLHRFFRLNFKDYIIISQDAQYLDDVDDLGQTENYYLFDFACLRHSGSGVKDRLQNSKILEVNDILLLYKSSLEDHRLEKKAAKINQKLQKLKKLKTNFPKILANDSNQVSDSRLDLNQSEIAHLDCTPFEEQHKDSDQSTLGKEKEDEPFYQS